MDDNLFYPIGAVSAMFFVIPRMLLLNEWTEFIQ